MFNIFKITAQLCLILLCSSRLYTPAGKLQITEDFSGSLLSTTNQTPTNIPTLKVVDGKFPYECPDDYRYLSYNAITLKIKGADKLACNANPQGEVFRLAGGDSLLTGEVCNLKLSDTNILSYNLCAKWTISDISLKQGDKCDDISIPLYQEDISKNAEAICDSVVDSNVVARIGLFSSVSTVGGICKIKRWDPQGLEHSVCFTPQVTEAVNSIAYNERSCGADSSLITLTEIVKSNNIDEYCKAIPSTSVVRLAGGSSLSGSENGCKVLYYDPNTLNQALCAPINRQ